MPLVAPRLPLSIFKNSPKVPTPVAIAIILYFAGFPVAAIVAMASEGAASKIAVGFLVLWALVGFLGWHIDAWMNERRVGQNQEVLRNEDIGSTVIAKSRFKESGNFSFGKVELNGELWDARCTGILVPKEADTLVVTGRQGLELQVRLVEQ